VSVDIRTCNTLGHALPRKRAQCVTEMVAAVG